MEKIESVRDALARRGFKAYSVAEGKEAVELVKKIVGKNSGIGFGGSVTVSELNLMDELEANGNTLYTHWRDGAAAKRKAAVADYYICSANAVTEDGIIVLTDGSGNRVSALSFGPANAIVIVGENKIVADKAAAEARIKSAVCAGANAKRLGFDLPCVDGQCTDCSSPKRICSVTAFFEKPSSGLENTYVILVGRKLGY